MKKITKPLSILLSLVMIFSAIPLCIPAFAQQTYTAPEYTESDLREISDKYQYDLTEAEIAAIASGEKTLSETVGDKEEDVTLIVQLSKTGVLAEKSSPIIRGKLTRTAKKTQTKLMNQQASVQKKIEKNVLGGTAANVLYSYTLLANAFAITAKPSQIDAIAAIPGVESVYTAPVYNPVPTDAYDPNAEHAANYFTGSDNTSPNKGTGTVVAVIDTGLDLTHDAFANDVTDPKLSIEDIEAALPNTNAFKNRTAETTAADVYRSAKVPFAFNYADIGNDFALDVSHKNDDEGDHGTHVSGIIAGYATDADGKVLFEGVAPDAQVMVFKVFGSDRAGSFADILAAVEDAVALGADVINLSLGSWAGFTYAGDYPDLEAAYQSAANAGIVVCASAGNEYSAAYGTLYGNNLSLASNPDNGIIGSPASYDDNLAVASMASKNYYAKNVQVNGRPLAYTCNATEEKRNIEKYAGETLDYFVLKDTSGKMLTGTVGDFESFGKDKGVEGKVVVVRRGQTFTVTAANAERYGAIAVIVCDNVNGSLVSMMENDSVSIPAIFISKDDGDYIAQMDADETVENTLYVSTDVNFVNNPAVGQMSDFSSWGVTSDLKLKPEITGYGGSVYSTRDDNTYGLMSGTSMSSPYVAGVTALVMQRINAMNAEEETVKDLAKKELAAALMMSTADPVVEADAGIPYSPRKQGAGLVDIDSALATNAYIKVEGSPTPKIDFGDDKNKTGVYALTFSVVNFGDQALSFNVSSTVQTEKVQIEDVSYTTNRVDPAKADAFIATGLTWNIHSYANRVFAVDELEDVKFMSGLPYDLSADSAVDADSVTVPAGETVEVTVTVTLGDEAKAYLDENFENGIYVEGFITLTSTTEGQPDLNVPFLAFYGDWTQAPILDEGTWEDNYLGNVIHPQMSVSKGASVFTGSIVGNFLYDLGCPTTEGQYDPFMLYEAGVTYIPNARNVFGGTVGLNTDAVAAELGLLRNVALAKVTVKDTETGELLAQKNLEYVRKSIYYSDSVGFVNGGYFDDDLFKFDGMNQFTGEYIEPATEITYTVEAFLDYCDPDDQNNVRNTFTFHAFYDGGTPALDDAKIYVDEATGDVMMETWISDDTLVSEVLYSVTGWDYAGSEQTAYYHEVFYPEYPGQQVHDTLNITEAAASANIQTVRVINIEIDDYAQREPVRQNPARDGLYASEYYFPFYDFLKISYPQNVLAVGNSMFVGQAFVYGAPLLCDTPETFEYLNYPNADNEVFDVYEEFIYTSSDPTVATVNEGGLVEALSDGYTTISVQGQFGKAISSFRLRVITNHLQALIDATPAGGTLEYTNGDLEESVIVNKDIVLDLGGATLKGVDGFPAVTVQGGSVTVKNGALESWYSLYSEEALFTDIIQDNVPALLVNGGAVTLDGVNVTGPTATIGGNENVVAGSAVKVTDGASLTVKDSDLYGLYAINNKDISAAAAGQINLVSGNFEGMVAALTEMKNVSVKEGSVAIDVNDAVAEEPLSYLGSIDGTQFDFKYPSNGYMITAEQLAAAAPSTGTAVTYDAEKDCAVFTVNADGTFRKFNTQYLKISGLSFDTEKYNFAVIITDGWFNNGLYSRVSFSATSTFANGSVQGVTENNNPYAGSIENPPINFLKHLGTCTNLRNKGVISDLYFCPYWNTYAKNSFTNGGFAFTGSINLYGVLFFETKKEADSYLSGLNIAATNNLKVANGQEYNTKLVFDGNTLNVNASFPEMAADGSYTWTPTSMSLYQKTDNGDNTFTETLVETKAITVDDSRETDVAFENVDPNAAYTVKCDFDLSITETDRSNLFHAPETDAKALVTNLPSLIEDQFGVGALRQNLVDLANFLLYDLREGFVERDARHYDCPLGSRYIANYPWYDEYPDIIGTNTDSNYVTWVDYFDHNTIGLLVGCYRDALSYTTWQYEPTLFSYMWLFADILGDDTMHEILADLPNTIPEDAYNMIAEDYRVGDFGCAGTIPAYFAVMDPITAATQTGSTAREQLVNGLLAISEHFEDIYWALSLVANSLYDQSASSQSYYPGPKPHQNSLVNVVISLDLANHYQFGEYNDRHAEFAALVEETVAMKDTINNAKNAFTAFLKNGSLPAALSNYTDNTADWMSLYFDPSPIENGTIDLGVTATYETEASYDGYITYELDGGKNAENNPAGYQVLLPFTLEAPEKEGYTFGGWYTSPDFAEESKLTATPSEDIGDITLYAKWTINTYTMQFVLNGEVIDTLAFEYGEATHATEADTTTRGYAFQYWYEDNEKQAYTFGAMPANDVVLTGKLNYISLDDLDYADGVYTWQFDDDYPVRLVISKNCTVDFRGKTVTNLDDLAAILVNNNAKVTIKNLILKPSADTNTSNENASVFVTGNANVTFENCCITGAKNEAGTYFTGSAVRVDDGTVTVNNSVLNGLYAVNNTKGDTVKYVPMVTVNNSVLFGLVAPFVTESRLTVNGTAVDPATLVAADAANYAADRFLAVFDDPAFTWEFNKAEDTVTVSADNTEIALPEGFGAVLTPAAATVDGAAYEFENGAAVASAVAENAYNHTVAVTYACALQLDEAFSNDLANADDLAAAAVQDEVDAFDALVSTYDDLLDNWNDHKALIKQKFYQYSKTSGLGMYLTNIRNALAKVGGAEYTGNNADGKGLIPTLSEYLDAYRANTTPAAKLAWLMQNKATVVSLTVELNANLVSAANECVMLNGLSSVYYGQDYSEKLQMVLDITEQSTDLRNKAEKMPSYAEKEYAAASDKIAFVNEILGKPVNPTAVAAIDKTVANVLTLTDTFDTYTVVYELFDEYTGETETTTYYLLTGDDIPEFTPEEREGRTFSGWTQQGSSFPVTKLTYTGTMLKNALTVTFKADGSEDIVVNTRYGDTVEIPAVPEKEHYTETPAVWDTDLTDTPILADTTVNAVYTPDVYTLTFKDLEEDVLKDATYGEAFTDIPAIPAKDHYTQTAPYWTADPTTGEAFDFTAVEADTELYIYYTPDVYTVTFVADGETIDEVEVTYGEALTELPAIPAKDHYTETEPTWGDVDFAAIGEDTVVNAVYTPDVYTVTYKAEGSEDIVIDVTYGETFEVPAVPEREHYTQTAPVWDTDLTGVIVEHDTEVVALYTPDVYVVTWNVEGAETTEEYTYGETPVFKGETAKACTASEYFEFSGWSPEITAAAADITYTAVFETKQKESGYTQPEGLTAVYGATLASVVLPNGYVWKDASQSVGSVGANTFIAVYTPEDTEHFLTEEVQVTVTVTKADPIVTVPNVYGVTGHKLSETALPAGWQWVNPNATLGAVGTAEYQAIYTPADTANYNPITVSIPLSVIVPAQYCAMNGHNYNSTRVTAPTCTANGYTTHICGMCGSSYNDSTVRALGHKYASSITLAPTCTANGVRTYKCTRCDSTYNEVIGATGHHDGNGDGKCDACAATLCTHLCHTTNGFMRVIWRVVNFFNKLFKINKYCSCGAQHW